MHFQLDIDTETFRSGVRDHLREVLTPEFEERIYRSGVAHDDDFAKGLVDDAIAAYEHALASMLATRVRDPQERGGVADIVRALGNAVPRGRLRQSSAEA